MRTVMLVVMLVFGMVSLTSTVYAESKKSAFSAATVAADAAKTPAPVVDNGFKCGYIPDVNVSTISVHLEAELNKNCRLGKVPTIAAMPGLVYYCCEGK